MQTRPFRRSLLSAAVLAALAASAGAQAESVRFATFNASLNRNASGDLLSDLANPGGADFTTTVGKRIQQAHNVAEIIQRIDPHVLLVNEFDYDASGTPGSASVPSVLGYTSVAHQRFQENFLAQSQGGGATGRTLTAPVSYNHGYTPTTNTGIASGFDLNNNGVTVTTPGTAGFGDDAFGFGSFPGQFGMTIYSKYEIVGVRTFQNFLWKDMPGNLLTNDPTGNNLASFYSPAEIDVLRLSSKNHVDLALNVDGQVVHFLTSHPTPPVFDGAEDRNGKRNYDVIRS